MDTEKRKVKALGLCSGGLDSILAGLVLRMQDIDVCWVSFESPFFSSDKARAASRETGIPLMVQRLADDYLEMLKNPRCGYGKHLNPCMDCHAFMFCKAGGIMEAQGFDFLFSGEVLGQRPMSQTLPSLQYVAKRSGYAGYILRPLSAKKLAPTIPEINGLVDREKLLDFSGRSRKPQMELAKALGVTRYPAPAGGCLLTDEGYTRRLADLFAHQQDLPEQELELLKHGRHFRLDSQTKAVVGRDRQDNEHIMSLANPVLDAVFSTVNVPGPLVLVPRGGSRQGLDLAAALCLAYAKAPKDRPSPVKMSFKGQESTRLLPPCSRENFVPYLL